MTPEEMMGTVLEENIERIMRQGVYSGMIDFSGADEMDWMDTREYSRKEQLRDFLDSH